MNTLLQEAVLSTQCFSHAIIVRRKDHLVKARTRACPLSSTDFLRLHELFEHPIATREQGFSIANVPYKAIRVDLNSIYGKVDEDAQLILQMQQAAMNEANDNAVQADASDDNSKSAGIDGSSDAKKKRAYRSTHPSDSTGQGKAGKHDIEVVRPGTASGPPGKQFNGIIICKTALFFVIAIYDRHPALAVECMERLAEYFRSKNR